MIVWEIEGERLDVKLAGAMLAAKGCHVLLVLQPEGRTRRRQPGPDRRQETLNHVRRMLDKDKAVVAFEQLEAAKSPDCILLGMETPDDAAPWIARGIAEHAVITCVSDFGLDGPYAGRPATELTVTQLSGVGYYIPGQVQHPQSDAPLGLPEDAVAYLTGLVAATATSAELYGRGTTRNKSEVLDVTSFETVASLTFGNVSSVAFGIGEPNRTAEARPAGWAVALLRCKDGYICLVTLEERQWKDWLTVLGNPEWASSPLFADRVQRSKHWDALAHLIEAITTDMPKAELAARAQARRVPCTAVSSVHEVLDSPQLGARTFFRPLSTLQTSPIQVPDLASLWGLQRSNTS